jgi:hypothetical protein
MNILLAGMRRARALAIPVFLFFIVCAHAQQLAFPSAEGYGRFAKGGRGGDVYHVTNVNDSGAGSLRYGLDNASGPRTIVFDVGGTILVQSQIGVTKSFITIAGQTAPGDGIQIAGKGLAIGDNMTDIVIRYIRAREGMYLPDAERKHSLNINAGCQNIIFDHCSAEFGRDESFSMDGSNITVQWGIIAWGLIPHSCGDLLRSKNITIHHTLWAHNETRNPKATGDTLDFVNNVLFDWWGDPFIAGDFGAEDDWSSPHNANVVGCYFIATSSTSNAIVKANVVNGTNTFSLYLSGTYLDGNANGTLDGSDQGYNIVSGTVNTIGRINAPQVKTDDAVTAYNKVLASAGCSLPVRDAIDARLVDDVRAQRVSHLTDHNELGFDNYGYGTLRGGTAKKDTDLDGMPDDWETSMGFNPNDANDRNSDADGDGFTNLEEYLAEMAGDQPAGGTTTAPTSAPTTAPTGASTESVTPAPTQLVLIGDVNTSVTIDIVDALLVAQYYVGLNPSNFNASAADVNRSGAIDIVDALLIAQYYVGLISGF